MTVRGCDVKRITENDLVEFLCYVVNFGIAEQSVSDKTKHATSKKKVAVGRRAFSRHLNLFTDTFTLMFMLSYIIRELDRLRSDVKKLSKKIGSAK